MPDREERLDHAERWLHDGFRVLDAPGGFALVDVDMTRAQGLLDRVRAAGLHATYTHLVARAAALALARRPELHFMVAGNRRLLPERIDIGLSVAGKTSFAPVMVLEDAGRKPLPALVDEITRRVPEVHAKEEQDLAGMRRWGWVIPWARLRRWILRWLGEKIWFRRKLAGTFQVSCSPSVDVNVPFLFQTSAVLGAGRVRDRVIAVDGQAAVRPVMTLSICIDHKAWDGVRAYDFVTDVKNILEDGVMEQEAP